MKETKLKLYCSICGGKVYAMVNPADGQFGYVCRIHGYVSTIRDPEKASKPGKEDVYEGQ